MFLKFAPNESLRGNTLYFYDLNLKANYTLNEKNRIFLSGYFGRDIFGFGDNFGFNWGNGTGTIRLNHFFSDKLFSNTSLIYSKYDYKISIGAAGFSFGSTIQDWNLKQDFQYFINEKHTLKFGLNAINHTFSPGFVDAADGGVLNSIAVQKRYGLEAAAYVSDEFKISPLFNVVYGVRFAHFTAMGPGDIYTYDNEGEVVDTTVYGKNKAYQTYKGFEPRIAANYIINEQSSVKASYARNQQFVHLLSNSTSSSPTDVWLLSSNNIKPQISDQVTLGYFRNLNKNMFELSVEGYYKTLENVIDYRTGADINFNNTVEGDLVYGVGRAYGVELLVRKKKGKFTGWLGYTLSRSERKFESINTNNWYPARQDRIHDISVVTMYSFTDRIKASASWVYYTGDAITVPTARYQVDGISATYYSERNGYRVPNYHRLDLGLTIYNHKFKTYKDAETGETMKKERKVESNWSFSVYNVYARENAFSISFRESETTPGTIETVQLSLFRAIPSISYNFKF